MNLKSYYASEKSLEGKINRFVEDTIEKGVHLHLQKINKSKIKNKFRSFKDPFSRKSSLRIVPEFS